MRLKRLFSDLPHVNILPYLYIFVYNISRIYAITSKSTFPQHDKIYIKPSFRPSSYIVLFHPPSLFIKIRIHILFLIPARAAVKNAIQLYLLPTRKKSISPLACAFNTKPILCRHYMLACYMVNMSRVLFFVVLTYWQKNQIG